MATYANLFSFCYFPLFIHFILGFPPTTHAPSPSPARFMVQTSKKVMLWCCANLYDKSKFSSGRVRESLSYLKYKDSHHYTHPSSLGYPYPYPPPPCTQILSPKTYCSVYITVMLWGVYNPIRYKVFYYNLTGALFYLTETNSTFFKCKSNTFKGRK